MYVVKLTYFWIILAKTVPMEAFSNYPFTFLTTTKTKRAIINITAVYNKKICVHVKYNQGSCMYAL